MVVIKGDKQSQGALGYTSRGRDDRRESPVVERREPNPGHHQRRGQGPANQVAGAVASGFSSELPESREVHF